MTASTTPTPFIRSDSLPELRRLIEKLPPLREYFGDILQVVLVLDASCVQQELRWRVGARRNAASRTYLHESIVSGVVLAFAPFFLEAEIEEHVHEIAEEEGVSVERVHEEWQQFKVLIRFYEADPTNRPDACPDPKDVDYVSVLDQVNGDFVYTSDPHFLEMGTRVMPAGLDHLLRDYARSTTVILTVKLGSGVAMIVGGHAIYALATLVVDVVRKLPPLLRLLLVLGATIALLHPDSRERIFEFAQKCLKNICLTALSALSSPAVLSLFEDASRAETSRKAVLDVLPLKKGTPAIAFAYRVCQQADGPLSEKAIAERVKARGYMTRSRNFVAYVRQILRKDSRFSLTTDRLWTLRAATR